MIDLKKAADLGQESITYFYDAHDDCQLVNNVYPLKTQEENAVFNYWWMAHLIDVRIDAYVRTKNEHYLFTAEKIYQQNKKRNKNTLRHEYYDDMLWNALAALRLFTLTGKQVYLTDAKTVCFDIFDTAWNEQMGGGFAWKRTQLDYKNTPVNAPIIILALRLYQIEKNETYLQKSEETLAWLQKTLVNPTTQFVEDGINRLGDGTIDRQWQFTYNQGVYIGALLEFYHVTKNEEYIKNALRCAQTAIEQLGKTGVFCDAGDGGDIGLFKGINYRYLALLYKESQAAFIKQFVDTSCAILVKNNKKEQHLLAYRDWFKKNEPTYVYLSDQLSGVMALESAVAIETSYLEKGLEDGLSRNT